MRKKELMKRATALLLIIALLAGCLYGCGAPQSQEEQMLADQESSQEDTQPITEPVTEATEAPIMQPEDSEALTVADGENVSYVMIYNPRIYIDDKHTASYQTGDLSSQINIDMSRADGLVEEPAVIPYDQQLLDPEFWDQINLEGGKADGLAQFYQVGDQQAFYCGSEQRTEEMFTCVHAGTHANIWVYSQLDQGVLDKLGAAFDEHVYDDCVSRFGEPRFGQVVNFLIYPMESTPNTVGFFYTLDLFSSYEMDDNTAMHYGANRDHNVVNINALWLEDETLTVSTLAHEFQHLLCFTGYFTAGNLCDVWFNEAMSGYIEESLYPGIKESDFVNFHVSNLIRNGQSLYNFRTDISMFSVDIGVYGAVFLFTEYLRNLAGEDVFSRFHENWRNTYTPMTTIEGIYDVMPEDVRQEIDAAITYPDSYSFASEAEEWISKLTLSFYLSMLTMDENSSENYRQIQLPYLLYDSLMDAQIEGGGRVIMATKDGTFQIPENADSGLVYVGLNENLEIVTNICYG